MIYLFLRTAVSVLNFLIVVRCFLSFIPHNPYNSILRYVYEITDPILEPCSRLLPESLRYPLDCTPIVALLLLQLLYQVLVNVLHVLF